MIPIIIWGTICGFTGLKSSSTEQNPEPAIPVAPYEKVHYGEYYVENVGHITKRRFQSSVLQSGSNNGRFGITRFNFSPKGRVDFGVVDCEGYACPYHENVSYAPDDKGPQLLVLLEDNEGSVD